MDIPGEKLISQMWETLTEKGIGSLLRPWQVRRDNRAINDSRRHDLLMLAQAERDAIDVRSGLKEYTTDGALRLTFQRDADTLSNHIESDNQSRIEPTLSLRPANIQSRLQADAIRNEINQTKAVIFAEELLQSDTQDIPSEKIDEDWLYAWRTNAGNTSNENIQRLWGNVLADEFRKPGSYSLRTLDFLKNLSKDEAVLIQSVAPFVLTSGNIWRNLDVLEEQGVSYDSLLALEELGLLQGAINDSISISIDTPPTEPYFHPVASHGKILTIKKTSNVETIGLPIIALTSIGSEIMKLGDYAPNIGYLRSLGKFLKSKMCIIEIGDYHLIDGNVSIINMQPLEDFRE